MLFLNIPLCIILQVMDALDVVNSNLSEAAGSREVCQKQIETVQQAIEEPDDSGLRQTACGDHSTDAALQQTCDSAVLETPPQFAQQAESVASQFSELDDADHLQTMNCDALDSNYSNEISRLTADVGELSDKSDKSTLKSAGSSAEVTQNKQAVTDRKRQSAATPKSKHVVGLQKNSTGESPRKNESTSLAKKVGTSPSVNSRQSSLTSRRSVDLSSSRSSAPSSSRVSSKPIDSTPRRPSVPKRIVKQPSVTGSSTQQNQMQRKSSAVSTTSCALLPDQKTTSESSLAAGDFSGDLPAVTSLRSSTPVTSSLGDSNDPSSISQVSSVSDASSPPASHGSTGALSASVFLSPKPSTSTGELQLKPV